MPSEAQVLEALRPVEDPEIHRSIVELNMVRGIEIDGGNVKVTVALTVAGCPMRSEIIRLVTDAVAPLAGVDHVDVDLGVMTEQERAALAQQLQGGHAHGDDGQVHRPNPFTDSNTARPRDLVGQGWRRQVVGHHEPRGRARAAGPQGRRHRRRRVGLLDAPHARHRPPADRHRRRHRPARRQRRHADLDGLLRPRGPARRVARPDAAQGARAVPHRRALGRARLPHRRHAPRHRRHRVVDGAVPAARRGDRRHHAAAGRAEGRATGRVHGAQGQPLRSSASSRTCRGSTCDHGTEYRLFGEGGGQELADQLEVPAARSGPARARAAGRRRQRRTDRRAAIPTTPPRRRSPRWPSASTSRWRPSASTEPSSRSSDG